jgi:predicted Zn-dependent protease
MAPYTQTPRPVIPPVLDRGVTAPERPDMPAPAVPEPVYPAVQTPREQPPAVVALLDHAEAQANSGDLGAAADTLERAIRIDSRNPVLWHHLAQVRLAEDEPLQAEQLATKSNSLAAGNSALQARNWQLIAEARRMRGNEKSARSAEAQARKLKSR